jgi:hypothetical protein
MEESLSDFNLSPEQDAALNAALGLDDDEDNQSPQAAAPQAPEPRHQEEDAGDDQSDEGHDESEDDEEGQEPVQASYADKNHKVRLDDGTEVSVADLIRGNMRDKDYTTKSQELAAQRQDTEARIAKLKDGEAAYDIAQTILLAAMPAEPTEDMLISNPMEYFQQKALYDQRLGQYQKILDAKRLYAEAQKDEAQRGFNEWADNERQRAQEVLPELKTKEGVDAFNHDLLNAVSKYGFTEDDVGGIYDHRFLVMARDLIEYQKIIGNRENAVQKVQGKPPLSPGKRQTNSNADSADLMKKWKAGGGKNNDDLNKLLDKFF